MININYYDSSAEIRRFCQKGPPSYEGSTPISSQPNLTEDKLMFAIRTPEGLYMPAVGNETCQPYEVARIKWYRWYLHAEECSIGTPNKTVDVMEVMKHALFLKDCMIVDLQNIIDTLTEEE